MVYPHRFKRFAEVVQRIAVLGEDEQLAPPIAQFLELGPFQAGFEGVQLGVGSVVADLPGLGEQFLQGGDFRPQLIEVGGGGELIRELVSLGVVEIVLVLLAVGQAALQLGKAAGSLGGRQVFEFLEERPAGVPAGGGSTRRWPSSNWPSRRWSTVRARATLACRLPARLRQELVDVGGDRLVEVVLLHVQLEGDRVRVPVGKEPPAAQVAEVFLEPAERPRAIGAELEDVAADLGGLASDAVRFGEQVRSR